MTIRYLGSERDGNYAYVYCRDLDDPFLITPDSNTYFNQADHTAQQANRKNNSLDFVVIRHRGVISSEVRTTSPRALDEIIRDIQRHSLTGNRPLRSRRY